MRLYTTSGSAEFHCAGHPIHKKGKHAHGDGHHSIVFVWAPGCVHIDDHQTHPLRGCDEGCESYVHTAGDDPRDPKHVDSVDSTELTPGITEISGA